MSKELSTLTLKQAIENITEKFPEEAKMLQAGIWKDIKTIGTDELFVLRDNDGEIRAFKQSLTLSLANGGLVTPVPGGPAVVSAQGYEIWAECAGASVIFPKEVLVDGQWQQNPAVVRDPANRRILAIYARAVAFRFSSKGIPQVSDWTTIFDTPSYRLIDLLGKAKKYPQAFRLLPTDMGKPEDVGTWAVYPFDESTNLCVNTSHEEALTWFAQILNREKKAIDFAQTFAKRNALKHLSGIQKSPGPAWTFPVLCWRPTSGNIIKWDASRYANLQDRVNNLIGSQGDDFAPESGGFAIEAKTGSERVSDESGAEELERQTDPEDQEGVVDAEYEESPKEPTVANQTANTEDAKIMANYSETANMFPAEFAKACKLIGVKDTSAATVEQAKAIIAKVSALIDEAA